MTKLAFPKPERRVRTSKPLARFSRCACGHKAKLHVLSTIMLTSTTACAYGGCPCIRLRPPPKTGHRIAYKAPRRSAKRTEGEKSYLAWMHRQACVGRILRGPTGGRHVCGPAGWPIQQAHVRNPGGKLTGLGRKESDYDSAPACPDLHDELDGRNLKGPWFGGWTAAEKMRWLQARVVECVALWSLETGVSP